MRRHRCGIFSAPPLGKSGTRLVSCLATCRPARRAAQSDRIETVVVTLDGEDTPALAQDLSRFDWPRPTTFAVSKLFLVIGAR